jgi:hypothetical protein
MGWSEDAARNRDAWDRITDSYHDQNAEFIDAGLAAGTSRGGCSQRSGRVA